MFIVGMKFRQNKNLFMLSIRLENKNYPINDLGFHSNKVLSGLFHNLENYS